ncbi:MAG: FKBP-type peptidyl-prolyl cis-trans isomerase [Gemmatimonadota bacterium]
MCRREARLAGAASRVFPALCTVFAFSLAACGQEAADEEGEAAGDTAGAATMEAPATGAAGAEPSDVTFAPALDIDLEAMERQPSGLYVQVLADGDGRPAASGDSMAVHYTLWLPDGREVDSSYDRGEPLPMVLGETELIDGWVEGVTGMREGERRRLVLPYQLGYGARGSPPAIPPYSTLVFEVELVDHRPAPGGS